MILRGKWAVALDARGAGGWIPNGSEDLKPLRKLRFPSVSMSLGSFEPRRRGALGVGRSPRCPACARARPEDVPTHHETALI